MASPSTAPIPLDLRPFDVAMSKDGRTLYACSADEAGCVFVLDTATHTVRGKIDCRDAHDMLLAPDGSRLYVTMRAERAVAVIDTSTNKVIDSIAMDGVPFRLAAVSGGDRIYATVSDPSKVAVIDTDSATVIRTIAVGQVPFGLTVSPDDARVYVTDSSSFDSALHVIKTSTDTVDGAPIPVGQFPHAAAVTPDGGRIFVVNNQDGTVSVVDAGTRTVISTIRVGDFPKDLLMDREGKRVYVGNSDDNTVSVIDVSTLEVARTLLVDGPPANLAATPDGHRIYAAGFREKLVLPFDTRTVTMRAGKRPETVTFTPNGRLCVTNPGDGTLSVVRTEAPSVQVGEDPVAVAVDADGLRVYVANGFSNDVSVIDTTTDKVTATIPSVPVGPVGAVALAPDGRRLYVAGTGQVSAIDTVTRTVVGSVPFREPAKVAVSPDGLRLYVTDADAGLVVLKTDPLGVVNLPVPLGGGPLPGAADVAVTPDGKHVYVVGAPERDEVRVIHISDPDTTTHIFPGEQPEHIVMSPVDHRAYIACTGSASVGVVDTRSIDVVGDPIVLPFAIQDLAVSPDGKRLYVTSVFGHAVVVIDTATRTRLETIHAGTGPSCLALTPKDGRHAYVVGRETGIVTRVDTNTTRVPLGGDPFDLAATSDGRLIYVTIPASGTVAAVDTVTAAVAGPPISVGGRPRSVALTSDDATLYVAAPGAVTVIDTATHTVTGAPIPIGDFPQGLALAPDNSRLYVADSAAGTVTVIDTAAAATTASVTAGVAPLDLAVTSDGARLFVADAGANEVLVLDTVTLAVVASVVLPGSPHGLAFSRDGRTLLVTIPSAKGLAEIDTATLKPRGVPVPVGSAPHGVAVSSDGSRAYVANAASDTVSVVDL